MHKIRIGLMGFGRIGRQLYKLAREDERMQIVAISDIGAPEILHYLLTRTLGRGSGVRLEGNYLVDDQAGGTVRTRLMPADHPSEIPWDVFGVDVVVDATGRFRSRHQLQPHIENGARRVLLSTLPESEIDRVILSGVNSEEANSADQIVSAGSSSTTAMALTLKVVTDHFDLQHASMTSVHAYTSDQSLQDYAGVDFRRSRSGAENIIPNASQAPEWVARVMPKLNGKLSGYALNVPVQVGSMLDMTLVFEDSKVTPAILNQLFVEAAASLPDLIQVTSDPIVSSDVKGCTRSLLVDMKATIKAGERMLKLLSWHESLGHAGRILEVAGQYADLDAKQSGEAA